MKQKIFIFLSGCVFGIAILISIGFYNIRKDKGKPLMGPKVHGNIRIIQSKTPDNLIPGIESIIRINKDEEDIIAMFFDEDEELDSVSYFHKGEIIFSASMLNRARQLYSYGGAYGYNYFDHNCDGILDTYNSGGLDRNIFAKGKWLKVNRMDGHNNIVIDEGVERVFVLDHEKGWVEKPNDLAI